MLLSEDREIRLRVSAEHSDRSKEEVPTDNCSSDSSTNCYYLLQSQQFGMDLKSQNANQRETKTLMERLNSLRLVQSTMTQKFEMCIKKLEHELDSKEAQNDFLREELKVMRREIKETKNDILLMKQYLPNDNVKKTRGKKNAKPDEDKDKRPYKYQLI